jgi:putative transcriptional regulator
MFSRNTLKVGSVLVTKPFVQNSFYKRSVVLIVEHSNKGTIGFILNKRVDIMVKDALEDFPDVELPLYFGGPMQNEIVYFIHSCPKIEDCQKIHQDFYWGGNYEHAKLLIETHQITKKEIRFFSGYSIWEVGQLQSEINNGTSWLLCKNVAKNLMEYNDEKLWHSLVSKMSSNYALFVNFSDDWYFN